MIIRQAGLDSDRSWGGDMGRKKREGVEKLHKQFLIWVLRGRGKNAGLHGEGEDAKRTDKE